MPGWFSKLWGSNRFSGRDVVGNAVIGDVSGILIQNIGTGSPADMPSLPWRDLSVADGTLGELDIFNLLSWRSRLTRTLVGREADRDRLIAWARDDPRPVAIRLLTGPGGAGKSRLAAEVATSLREERWSTGLVSLDKTSSLPVTNRGLFVVIDYPEAHRAAVSAVLRGAGLLESPQARLRLLLLSRQPLEWWLDDIAAARASELCDTQESTIGPLDTAEVGVLVHQAAGSLADLRHAMPPALDDAAIAAWHVRNPALHGLPLFATAAAVHAVLDPAPTFELTGEVIIRALMRRERRRLDQAGRNTGWGDEAASRLHGLAAIRNGLDAAAVRRLAAPELETGLPPPQRVIDAIRSLGWWETDRVPAPSPPLPTAELLYQILVERADRAAEWLAAALADAAALEIERLGRLAHDMAILHGPATDELPKRLIEGVARDPGRADLWREIGETDRLPFRLSGLAVAIGQALLAQPALDDAQRAALLNNLSNALSDAGDRPAALAAIREAVDLRRRLAAANPARFEPDLARSLRVQEEIEERFR